MFALVDPVKVTTGNQVNVIGAVPPPPTTFIEPLHTALHKTLLAVVVNVKAVGWVITNVNCREQRLASVIFKV